MAPALLLPLLAALASPARAEGYRLEEAWAAAEATNLEVQAARARTEEAAALRLEALSIQLPRVSTRWTAALNDQEVVLPDELLAGLGVAADSVPPLQARQTLDGSITLTQPLLRPAVIPAVQAASRAWRAAQADEARVRQQVRAAVAKAWWGLLSARAAQDVAESNLALAEAQQVLARRRTEAGLEGRRADLQAELGVSRANRQVLSAAEAVAGAESAWRSVLGEDPRSDLTAPEPPAVPDSLEEALAAAAARRPDLRAAEERWQAARRQRTLGDLGWLPTLDLAVQARFNLAPTVFNPLPAQAGVGVQLNWEFFDGGLRIARSQQARARARLGGLDRDVRARDARQEVRAAWQRLVRARAAVDAVEAEVELAEEDLELAQRGLDAGSATLLDVQGARLSTASARLARIQERATRDLAAIELLLAMGTL